VSGASSALRYLYYGLFFAIVTYLAWRHGRALWRGLLELLADLRSLFTGRPAQTAAAAAPVAPAPAPPRPFASYSDPFVGGTARKMSPMQLLDHTFRAFEAWSRERGCPREADATPLEFAAQVEALEPGVAAAVSEFTTAYCRALYTRTPPGAECQAPAQALWRTMTAARPAAPVGA
jgi:hypothetical protein